MPRAPEVKAARRKRVPATGTVDAVVVKRLELLGVDVPKLIEKLLNEAAGHHTCPVCHSLLKVQKKEL